MTVIGKFMKRLGWVRDTGGGSSQRFEGDPGVDPQFTGAIGSEVNWSFVPEAPIDAARAFDPSLAAPAPTFKPALPSAVQAQAAPVEDEEEEEENLWLAAVAKAKSREMPVVAAPVEAVEDEEDEEDWEALMAAARQRAENNTTPVSRVLAAARERAKSEPPVAPTMQPVFATVPAPPARPLDAASAQVEQGAVAANDRLPVQLSSLAASGDEDEEWLRLRAEVDAKENAENERKLRAMREIRRLRGNRGNTGNVPTTKPLTRRFAAGTVQPPVVAAKKPAAVIIAPRAAKPRPKSLGATTTRSIPRITQRLKSS